MSDPAPDVVGTGTCVFEFIPDGIAERSPGKKCQRAFRIQCFEGAVGENVDWKLFQRAPEIGEWGGVHEVFDDSDAIALEEQRRHGCGRFVAGCFFFGEDGGAGKFR